MIIRSRESRKYTPKDGHTKYTNSDGDYVPSVTTILKVIPKESLIYWANSLGWKHKSVQKELNESSYVGTCVHEMIEEIMQGKKPYNMKKLMDENEKIKNSMSSFIKWWKKHKDRLKVIDVEKEMSCDKYGGTTDLICEYDDELIIVDFKTSGDFYFSMYIQLAAYVKLYEQETGKHVKDVAVLRVDKKNGEKARLKRLSDIPNGDIDYYYSIFKACLELYNALYVLEKDWS